MGSITHTMDEVAARMEINDPNDPRVQAEVARLLSVTDRRLLILITHPNSGGCWVGKMGTTKEVMTYLIDMAAKKELDYVGGIIELKEGAEQETIDWLEVEGDQPLTVRIRPPKKSSIGTPPLPGLEARLARIKASAYGQQHSVWGILQSLTDEEIALTFSDVLETVLQSRTVITISEVESCQSH